MKAKIIYWLRKWLFGESLSDWCAKKDKEFKQAEEEMLEKILKVIKNER